MGCLLSILLFIFPVLELWILFLLSATVPLSSVFIICGITAAFGLWQMRTDDWSLWTLMESEIQNQRLPTEELLDALFILFSGVFLLFPGIITDSFGIALVLPPIREWLVIQVRTHLKKKIKKI